MDRQRFLIPALALLTVWRLALLPTIELSPDEALALFYTKHPALWYLEMGPLVPWLVKLGTLIAGEGALGVRLFAPFLALAATLCLWRLVRGLLGIGVAAWTVLLLQVLHTILPQALQWCFVPVKQMYKYYVYEEHISFLLDRFVRYTGWSKRPYGRPSRSPIPTTLP
jgi:hypothetical protein